MPGFLRSSLCLIARRAVRGVALLSLSVGLSAGAALAGDWRTTEIEGREIFYYTPERLEGRPAPLLIALHSDFGNARAFAETFPIYQLADRKGFRVAYVDGTEIQRRAAHRDWNAGDCCGDAAARGVDDVSFLKTAIASAQAEGLAWPESTFLFGHSGGAMLAYRYGCTYPETIRGIVAVSGTLAMDGCANASGLRVLAIHGAADRIVPWSGGQGTTAEDFDFMGQRETLNALHRAGAEVDLLRLERGGHAWGAIKARFLQERGFSLSDRIADFIDDNAHR